MLNINAPIVANFCLGGIYLGWHIDEVLANSNYEFEIDSDLSKKTLSLRYKSDHIDFWIKDNLVWQIMAHSGYQGKIQDKIALGNTLQQVGDVLGDVKLVEEMYMVKGLPGIAFEPEPEGFDTPIVEIYVFRPLWYEAAI
jgi:hypothetical protein